MRYSRVCGLDVAECFERLTANAVVATVLSSFQAFSDTVESEGRHEAVLNVVNKKEKKIQKIPLFNCVIFLALRDINIDCLKGQYRLCLGSVLV
jgi:hypothetical protein